MGANFSSNLVFAAMWGYQFWCMYPLKACLSLMHLGYDPFPITTGTPYFSNQKAYYFPNLFSYLSWLQLLVGFRGCFTGATTWLAYNFLYYHVEKHCETFLDKNLWTSIYDPDKDPSVRELGSVPAFLKGIVRSVMKEIVLTTTTRPLVVVMIRQLAQIFDDEVKYTSFLQAIPLIFSEEGLSGLFRGLQASLACNIIFNTGWNVVIYFVAKFIHRFKLQERFGRENMIRLRTYIAIIPWYFVFYAIYPLYIVGQIKAVEGSELRAASLPFTPEWTTSFWKPFNETEDRRAAIFLRRQFTLPGQIAFQEDGKPFLPILR